jgi:hypothetical protein
VLVPAPLVSPPPVDEPALVGSPVLVLEPPTLSVAPPVGALLELSSAVALLVAPELALVVVDASVPTPVPAELSAGLPSSPQPTSMMPNPNAVPQVLRIILAMSSPP